MKEIAIQRALNDETRKQGILIAGEVYSLHITKKQDVYTRQTVVFVLRIGGGSVLLMRATPTTSAM